MSFLSVFSAKKGVDSGVVITVILIAALVGFEIFNFDTTRYALLNLFSGLRFAGMEWATILAFAFCSIDFAGLIRMFTPEQGRDEPKEVWLLLGAWFLGATMNAVMTWYAVALAINGRLLGASLISYSDMLFYAPIFVAILVWLTRILFIGAISITMDKLLHGATTGRRPARRGQGLRGQPLRGQPLRQQAVRQPTASQSNGEMETFEEDFF